MSNSRRAFMQSVAAAFGGSVALPAILEEAAYADVAGDCDAVRLAKWIECYGHDVVAEQIIDLLRAGELTMPVLKNRLNRKSRREQRAKQSRERRERHAGDEILYSGPVHIEPELIDQLCRRDVRTVNRRAVRIGESDGKGLAVRGIGSEATSIDVPAGSRILIDLRHATGGLMACEVVRTNRGEIRFHAWSGGKRSMKDVVPSLSREGGLVFERKHKREIGLLGLPIDGA